MRAAVSLCRRVAVLRRRVQGKQAARSRHLRDEARHSAAGDVRWAVCLCHGAALTGFLRLRGVSAVVIFDTDVPSRSVLRQLASQPVMRGAEGATATGEAPGGPTTTGTVAAGAVVPSQGATAAACSGGTAGLGGLSLPATHAEAMASDSGSTPARDGDATGAGAGTGTGTGTGAGAGAGTAAASVRHGVSVADITQGEDQELLARSVWHLGQAAGTTVVVKCMQTCDAAFALA